MKLRKSAAWDKTVEAIILICEAVCCFKSVVTLTWISVKLTLLVSWVRARRAMSRVFVCRSWAVLPVVSKTSGWVCSKVSRPCRFDQTV